ncbi:MAG: hypothetical protein AAB325_16925, partial [Pseudomonadota bacterium]
MKKIYPLCLLILSGTYINAQSPTITSCNLPIIGDTIYFLRVDTTGLTEGNKGANITWNFSSLTLNGQKDTTIYYTPSATPFPTSFPSSNYSATDNGSAFQDYGYYDNQTTGTTLLGGDSPQGTTNYSDTWQLYWFPLNYLDSLGDSFKAVFNGTSGATIRRQGTSKTVADGYGTLILPTGTYPNVLRIKLQETETDYVFFGASFIGSSIITLTQFYW